MLLPLCGDGADLSCSVSRKNVQNVKLFAECADCSLPPSNRIVTGSAFINHNHLLHKPFFFFE